MTALQRYAWYNLAVVAFTAISIAILYPIAGKGSLGGFGFLGLLGLGPLFFRKKPGRIVMDERDESIRLRAWNVAFALFWVTGVLAASLASPAIYGETGAIPVWIVQSGVFVGMMLIYFIASISILVQYRWGQVDGE